MPSGEFLKQYSVPFEMDKDGTPGVKLRSVDGGTACQFMVPEGCSVYENRPRITSYNVCYTKLLRAAAFRLCAISRT